MSERTGRPVRAALPEDDAPVPFDLVRFATLPQERRRLLLHINGIVDEIMFGSVVLVLHDGRVIQVETAEKIRPR